MPIPCSVKDRELNKFVESETRPNQPAVDVNISNDIIDTNCNGDKSIRVVVDNGGNLICEKGVFNLIAGVPFNIPCIDINEVCDATFYQDNGKMINISYKNLVTSIEICSKKTLVNLVYKIEGKKNCI